MSNPGLDRGSTPTGSHRGGGGGSALRFSPWNFLLLLPLLMLITGWYNKDGPRLLGLPFFYWYQLAFVVVGVASVAIVYAATKDEPGSRSVGTRAGTIVPSSKADAPEDGELR